jgi:hypothetical protein
MLDIAALVGRVGSAVVWVILNILALIHTSVLAWRGQTYSSTLFYGYLQTFWQKAIHE